MNLRPLLVLLALLTAYTAYAQCEDGYAGFPSVQPYICAGQAGNLYGSPVDVPDGYGHFIFISSSTPFDFATVSDTILIDWNTPTAPNVPSDLSPGNYYTYTAMAPKLLNGQPDYDSECFSLGGSNEFEVVDLVVNELPDTISIDCTNPDFSLTATDNPHPSYRYYWWYLSASGEPTDWYSANLTLNASQPGRWLLQTDITDGFGTVSCSEFQEFWVEYDQFVLPQVDSFSAACLNNHDVCIEPWDASQTYELDGVPITDPCLGNLPVGSYSLFITRPDCPGSSQTIDLVVIEESIAITSYEIDPDCGQANGQLIFVPTQGSPPFQASLNNGPQISAGNLLDSLVFDDLIAGQTYVLNLTDATGCSYQENFTTFSSLIDSFSSQQPICADEFTGSLTVHVSDPDAPYTIIWSTGHNSPTASDLSAGTYGVTVTTASGCVEQTTIDLEAESNMEIRFLTFAADCEQNNGKFIAEIEGGVYPFSYQWSTGDTTARAQNLRSSTYHLTVTDDLGCVVTETRELSVRGIEGFIQVDRIGSLPCNDSMTVKLNIANTSDSLESVTWFTGSTSNSDTISMIDSLLVYEPGIYNGWVNLTTDSACIQLISFNINGQPNIPNPMIEVGPVDNCGYPLLTPRNFYQQNSWTLPDGSEIEGTLPIQTQMPGWYRFSTFFNDFNGGCMVYDSIFIENTSDCGALTGILLLDLDGNCTEGGNELAIPNQLVSFNRIADGQTYFAISDPIGQWAINLPAGDYELSHIPITSNLTSNCLPLIQRTVVADQEGIPSTLLVSPAEECPRIRTTVSTPFLRRCFNNTLYVNYYNEGTSTATAATLEVVLDDFLIFNSASLSPTSIEGQVLVFSLGDIPPFSGGMIFIETTVSCDAVLGQSHCITATASPASPCPTADGAWTGATVNARMDCSGDSPRFIIANIGTGDMSVPLSYIIVEDGVMLQPGQVESTPLPAGEEILVELPSPGASYWIQTNQEPLSPGDFMPTAFLEGCGTNQTGGFSTGFANQFSDGDGQPWFDELCLENIGAYDPNDKSAIPVGYGPEHFIEPATILDYSIRFQNTGTDTAFNVVLRDTLSPLLDCASLRLLSASHPYRAELDTNAVLSIHFDNIQLPDSSVDFRASQGYIAFQIQAEQNRPLPFEINNRAGIYFDFNDPIITNTVSHTVDTNFIDFTNSIFTPLNQLAQLSIHPNPSPNGLFELGIKTEVPGPYLVRISDIFGRTVWAQELVGKTMQIDLSRLSSANYNLSLFDRRGKWLGTTQIIR